jgi:hypothetical protein
MARCALNDSIWRERIHYVELIHMLRHLLDLLEMS